MYKSKIELSQEDYWNDVEVSCELCNTKHKATDLSTCDRCGRFVCTNCSEAVCNRRDNPYSYDFLCDACKEELDFMKVNLEGKNILRIGRFEPSSKTCSNCGYIMDEIPLDVREWECPSCHVKHDRDINAAKNIKQIALYKEFSGLGQSEEPVEMSELSESMKQESDCFSYR